MENQPQTKYERRALSVLATLCYLLALAGAFAFSYALLSFVFRVTTQQTSVLYSLPG